MPISSGEDSLFFPVIVVVSFSDLYISQVNAVSSVTIVVDFCITKAVQKSDEQFLINGMFQIL